MKKKGFTLIELLVVIAIIAMLLAILMPALNKVKKIAQRVVCGTNLKGFGNAMMVYANDFDGDYACLARNTNHRWQENTIGWDADPYPMTDRTVGASLYLLVRLADVSPKSFVCPASQQAEFSGKNQFNKDIVELWDFGTRDAGATWDAEGPARCVSYAYQQPYNLIQGGPGKYRADDSRSAAFAVMADRNPWYDTKLTIGAPTTATYLENVFAIATYWQDNYTPPAGVTERQAIMVANAQPHEREGQNVMFADGHASFDRTSDVGVKNDNIYTKINTGDLTPTGWRVGQGYVKNRTGPNEDPSTITDSLLASDFFL